MIAHIIKSSFSRSFRAGVCALVLSLSTPLMAQNIPSEEAQEAVIKSSLMTFNDANLSGNYSVLNALGSKPFRESLSADKLKDAFKGFRDKEIDLSAIVLAEPKSTKPTKIDSDGVMYTEGYFDTPKMRVNYSLKHLLSDGKWKLLGITVRTEDPVK